MVLHTVREWENVTSKIFFRRIANVFSISLLCDIKPTDFGRRHNDGKTVINIIGY